MLSEWLAGERLAKPSRHEKTFPKVKSLSWEKKNKKQKKARFRFVLSACESCEPSTAVPKSRGCLRGLSLGTPITGELRSSPWSLWGCVNPFWAGVQPLARLLREIQGKWEVKPRFGDFGGRERD